MELVAERLQKRLHVIDTIIEEEEQRPESAMDVKEPTAPSGTAVSKTEENNDDIVKDTIDAVLQKVIDDREKQQS